MEIFYVLDASAFINGFQLETKNNFTVPEITSEIKDFESRLKFDAAIDENRLVIQDVTRDCIDAVDEIISESGDILRLSVPDKKLIALAYMFHRQGKNVKVISDDYTIQNVCEGCKKEYGEDYPFDDCEICGSKIFKRRIKVNK